MRSLFQVESLATSQVRRTVCLSIGTHAIALALIVLGSIHIHRTIIFRPMTRGSVTSVSVAAVNRGTLASILAIRAPISESSAARPLPAHKLSPLPAKSKTALQAPTPPSQTSAGQASSEKSNPGISAGAGNDAQSMYPAYPVVSPSPQVKDRALLPQTDERVVVDVNLGADGQVQEAKLVSGLGNALDQVVLDTVRIWQFHPAMLNGGPVPSSIELVFPFNRKYPIAE